MSLKRDDGASDGVLHGELGALYGALRAGGRAADAGLAPMRLQYVDFAVWQREALSGVLEGQLSYWRSQLREGLLPVLELPLDYARPATQTFAGGSVPVRIGAGVVSRLDTLGVACGATRFQVVLALWSLLLWLALLFRLRLVRSLLQRSLPLS